MMIINFLADAGAQPELMKILGWVTSFVGATLTIVLAPLAKKKWKAEGAHEAHVTVRPPFPTVTTREEVELVTKDELDACMSELRSDIAEIKTGMEKDQSIGRQANGNIHKRIDAMSERFGERLSGVEGTMRGMNETLGKLLDLALNKPRPR